MGEVLSFVAPDLLLLAVIAFAFAWGWRHEHNARKEIARLRARLDRETARVLDGLPPHPRCLCAKCRAWRQVPGNAELLRLRGGG